MQMVAASFVVPVTSPPVAGGALVLDGGRIVAVGSLKELRAAYNVPCREYPGCVILPGLVNAHAHLELTHFPAWKVRKGIDYSPRTYVDWVIQVVKIRRALTQRELEHSVREGIRVSVECGTTAIGEISTDRALLPLYGAAPLVGRLFFEAIGQEPAGCERLRGELDAAVASFRAGSFHAGISPHACHTLSSRFMGEIVALARSHGVPTAIHLSESREEAAFLHDSGGKIAELLYPFAGWQEYLPAPQRTTSTAYLDALGVLDAATTVVHCVHVTPADAETLNRRGVSAVLCPRSNERLAVGKAPALLLKKSGIPLALGTDSLASNDSLSLWDEMRFLLRQFPDVFSPREALEMASINAARALHLEGETGSLEKGKRGDFLVVAPSAEVDLVGLHEAVIEESKLQEVFIAGQPASI